MRLTLLAGLWRPFALSLLFASTAAGQDQRPRALVIGGPSVLGYLVPVGERWDLRPDLSLSFFHSSSSGSAFFTSDRSSWGISAGLSGLRYFGNESELRTYSVYRLGVIGSLPSEGSNFFIYEASAGVGVHAEVAGRLGLFTEVGMDYSFSQLRFGTASSSITGTSHGVRGFSRLGVTLRRRAREPQRP